MNFINLTPHPIVLNDGRIFTSTGMVARVRASFSAPDAEGVCTQIFGEIQDLPGAQEGTMFIVSGLVLSALNGRRHDVVGPATGHPDTIRNEAGQIVSVPCFVR